MAVYEKLASIYDRLMTDVDYTAWAQGIIKVLRTGQVINVADLACGTGNITLPLAREGYMVTGVDASTDMLMIARQKADREGLRIPFIAQDVRKLALMRPVDAAVMACDGVNYLLTNRDVITCFKRVWDALKPGGLFIFDISTRYKIEQVIGSAFFGMDEGDTAYLWKNRVDAAEHRLYMDITFFVRERDGRYARFDEVHIQRAHEQEEIETALAGTGFILLECCDDLLKGTPPGPESLRMHFVAQRAGRNMNG